MPPLLSTLCQTRLCGLLKFRRGSGAVVCKMPILDFRTVLCIHVGAMKTPTDYLGGINLSAATLARGRCPLLFSKPRLRQSAIVRHGFKYSGFMLGNVLGAWTEFHRTIA